MKYKLISPIENKSAIEKIFENREVPISDYSTYKNIHKVEEFSPISLGNMRKAVELFTRNIETKKTAVVIDSDADGYTSSSVLLNYIYDAKIESALSWFIHPGKEHGITDDIVNLVKEHEIEFLIVPDAGSGQIEYHQQLSEMGVEVLVLDHHEAEEPSPYAVVVNPQLDDYPNKELSGVGIVYKFCRALDRHYKLNLAENYLDLVALGMVADLVDIRSLETRSLIMRGLSNIRNPFMKALLEKQNFSTKGKVTPMTLAFYIGPLINAVIRVGAQEEKEKVFLSFLHPFALNKIPSTKRGAKEGATEMQIELGARICTNVKSRQSKIQEAEFNQAKQYIEQNGLADNKIIAIISDGENKNLSGLIANKLVSEYQRPVLMLRMSSRGFYEGSGRGYDKSEFKDFKSFLIESGHVEYAAGHSSAFGCSFPPASLVNFIQYANKELEDIDFTPQYSVDYIYDGKSITQKDVLEVGELEAFWGKGFEEPLFKVEGVKLTKSDVSLASNGKTLKFVVNGITFIKFSSSPEEFDSLVSDGYVEVDVIGKFGINEWNGEVTPQVQISDLKVTKKQHYYF